MTNPALIPVPGFERDFYDWPARHAAKVAAARARQYGLVLIGDSITHLFEGDPAITGDFGAALWQRHLASNALNLGFGFDRTQNVLWRLDQDELTGQTPDIAVVMIGTNNLADWGSVPATTPAQTAAGIIAVCDRLHQQARRVILMAILPRGGAADPLRHLITETNHLLVSAAANRSWIEWVDIGTTFLDDDGNIPKHLMGDACHPTTDGYRIWLAALAARGCLLATKTSG